MTIRTIVQPFYTLWVVLSFLVCLLALFPAFLLLGMRDSASNRKLIYIIIHYWAKGWLWIIGMPLQIKGRIPKDRKYIYIANHQSYLDTVCIYAGIPNYFRTLAMQSLAKIPVFGFVYKQLAILVDRSSPYSRTRSMKIMYRQLRQECDIAIFPEGQFNLGADTLKSFYNGAFNLSFQTQVALLPLIFPDTASRWHPEHWWKIWPGKNRMIVLAAIDPSEFNSAEHLKQAAYEQMHSALAPLRY